MGGLLAPAVEEVQGTGVGLGVGMVGTVGVGMGKGLRPNGCSPSNPSSSRIDAPSPPPGGRHRGGAGNFLRGGVVGKVASSYLVISHTVIYHT